MYKEALQLERDLGNESLQAICLNNIGTTYSLKGQFEDALAYFQQALQLREKSNVPADIVEAVHNLADTSAEMGQYEQAISQYLRALDLRRNMDDKRGAAIESYSLGKLFSYQGRFGAAIKSKDEALKTFRDLKDRTYWMAEMLGGYGQALVLGGRSGDAKDSLTEALSLSTELKNDGMVAQSLGFQGDVGFYRGDFKAAETLYTRALQTALRSKEPDKIVIAKSNLAKVLVMEKHAAQAISILRPLTRQADEIGVRYISVECSIFMAEAMLQSRNNIQARQELDRALLRADKSGMQPLSARIHFLLAGIENAVGNTNEAQNHSRETLRLLDEMKKDPGAENLLQRADFTNIYEVSNQRLK
jgi:tetratricopeptide (TPR) repeat protein